MEIDQLIAALAPLDVPRAGSRRDHRPRLRRSHRGAGQPLLLRSGDACGRPHFAADAVANGAVARGRAAAGARRDPARRPRARGRRWRVAADEFFGRPTEELQVVGVTGTNGKTTTAFLLYALLAAAGRRPGPARDDREPRRRRAPAGGADDARGDRPPARVPRDARRRRPQRGGRGDLARLRARPARPVRFSALVFTNLTQDHLDFHGSLERVLRREAAAVHRDPAAGGRQRGRRARAPPRRGAARAATSCSRSGSRMTPSCAPKTSSSARVARASEPAGSSSRPGCAAASTSRTCSAPSPQRACSRIPEDAIAPASGAARRARPLRGGRRGPALRGARRLRAHARLARERPAHGARPRPEPPDLRLRLRRRPRPRQAAADGPDRRRARRPSRSSPPTTRAARSRRRSSPRSSPARPTPRSSPTGARRSRARSARRAEGDVVVIAGKGHEQGQQFADRRSRSTTATSRARRCGGWERRRDPAARSTSCRARPARARAEDDHRRARRLAPGRARRPVRRGRPRASSSCDDALARGAAATLVPDEPSTPSRRSARRPRPLSGARRRHHRLDRQDLDEGHPRRALRARGPHDRDRGELQQRDRRPATLCRLEPRHGGLHPRARDARLRPDRRALRVARPTSA